MLVKKKKEKFHLQVLPLLIKHFLVSKKKCLLKHALETRYINTTNFQSQSQGAALWRGEHRAWHKSRAGHFLESEWTRHRWGMSDATAKDDSRSPALKYKVNILYPPTAKWANDSQRAGSACLWTTPHQQHRQNQKPKSPNQQKLLSISMDVYSSLCSHSFGMKALQLCCNGTLSLGQALHCYPN